MPYTQRGDAYTAYRRTARRTRRPRRPGGNGRTFFWIFIAVAAICYVALASGLGKWIAESWVIPSLEGAGEESAEPESSAPPEETATLDIELGPMQFYAVQLGAYSTQESADAQAKLVRERGGAGYVLSDGNFRVLAGGYAEKADAETVKAQLETQGQDVYLYVPDPIAGLTLRVTGNADELEKVRTACSAWKGAVEAMSEAVAIAQRGEDSQMTLYNAYATICTARDGVAALADESAEIAALRAFLVDVAADLSDLQAMPNKEAKETVALCASLQYTILKTYAAYGDLLKTLAAL